MKGRGLAPLFIFSWNPVSPTRGGIAHPSSAAKVFALGDKGWFDGTLVSYAGISPKRPAPRPDPWYQPDFALEVLEGCAQGNQELFGARYS